LDTGEKTSPVIAKCICGCEEEIYRGEVVWATINGLVIEDHWSEFVVKELRAKQIYARGD
jgi:hypothetical protein